jgi:alpha-tubulin suppressor-like RCC1 family protein
MFSSSRRTSQRGLSIFGSAIVALLVISVSFPTMTAPPKAKAVATTYTQFFADAWGKAVCALDSSNTYICWGKGSDGNLTGQVVINPRVYAPVALNSILSGPNQLGTVTSASVGTYNQCVVVSGALKCIGYNGDSSIPGPYGTSATVANWVTNANFTSNVVKVVGSGTRCALKTGGDLWCWGRNSYGQLGNGNTTDTSTPAIAIASGVSDFSAGLYNVCAIMSADNSVKCAGFIYSNGSTVQTTAFNTVSGITNATEIAAMGPSTCAVDSGGVKCWGNGTYGLLGIGTTGVANATPTYVTGLGAGSNVNHIYEGPQNVCATTTAGAMYCWGLNTFGQIGNGNVTQANTPYQVYSSGVSGVYISSQTICAQVNGSLKCFGSDANGATATGTDNINYTFQYVTGLRQVSQVSVGNTSTCALITDGTVRCWGDNVYGEMGNGNSLLKVLTPDTQVTGITTATQIAVGLNQACALLTDQTVKCWGSNSQGRNGNGTTVGNATTPTLVTGISTATQIAVSYNTGCALLANHTVKCWGNGATGGLGNGTVTTASTPVTVSNITTATSISANSGSLATCALLSDKSVQCWGYGKGLGLGATTNSSPVTLTTGADAVFVGGSSGSSNYQQTCVVIAGNSKCIGTGYAGDGTATAPATLTSASTTSMPAGTISSMTSGGWSTASPATCAIHTTGAMWCWGYNYNNVIGLPSANGVYWSPTQITTPAGDSNFVQASQGNANTCALTTSGYVACAGLSTNGETGNGIGPHIGVVTATDASSAGTTTTTLPVPLPTISNFTVPSLTYGAGGTFSATASVPGAFTFKVGGTALSAGCTSVATSGSGSSNTASCTWSPSAVGSQTFTVDFVPTVTANYGSLSAANSTTVTVAQASQASLSINTTSSDYNVALTLGTTGGTGTGAVTYTLNSAGTAGCVLTSGSLSATQVGTCTVTATKAADTNYAAISSSTTVINFNPIGQSALAVTTASAAYDQTISLTTTGGSGAGAVTFVIASTGTANCSLNSSTLSATTPGTCTVTATKAANGNYSSVTSSAQTITFNKKNQSAISLADVTGTYGTTFTLGITGGAGTGTVSYTLASAGSAGCSLNGTSITVTSIGSCSVTATKVGDTYYNDQSSASTVITFGKASQASLALYTDNFSFGDTLTVNVIGGSGDGAYSFTLGSAGTAGCSLSGSTLSASSTGTCTIAATRATAANYLVKNQNLTVTVNPALQQVITITSTSGVVGSSISLTYTGGSGTGLVTWSVSNVGTAGCGLVGNSLLANSAGTCMVSITKAADSNYLVASTSATVTISPVATTTTTSSTSIPASTSSVVTQSTVVANDSTTTSSVATAQTTPQVNVKSAAPTTVPPTTVAPVVSEPNVTELGDGPGVLVLGGATTVAKVTRENDKLTLSVGNFSTTLSAIDKNGKKISLDSRGALRVPRGATVKVAAGPFAPTSRVFLWIFSTPTPLGERVADGAGKISTSTVIPQTIELGVHRLAFVGKDPAGKDFTFLSKIVVGDPPKISTTGKVLIAIPIALAIIVALMMPPVFRRRRRRA